MMTYGYTHGREFVEQVRPLLERCDVAALLRRLDARWPESALVQMLSCGHEDAVMTALVALSLVGGMGTCFPITVLLHEDNRSVAGFAEHALWAIWFRGGTIRCNERLADAVRLISTEQLDPASRVIESIVRECPGYAEAHNQLAIVRFMQGRHEESRDACIAALRLNPLHFAAVAGLGHCYVALGQLDRAWVAYERALQIHPRMEGVRQSIRHIRRLLRTQTPALAARTHLLSELGEQPLHFQIV
ncbi:MAG: hypothetical protein AMXMBFR13_40030 [Phycisphaerae bacterium]